MERGRGDDAWHRGATSEARSLMRWGDLEYVFYISLWFWSWANLWARCRASCIMQCACGWILGFDMGLASGLKSQDPPSPCPTGHDHINFQRYSYTRPGWKPGALFSPFLEPTDRLCYHRGLCLLLSHLGYLGSFDNTTTSAPKTDNVKGPSSCCLMPIFSVSWTRTKHGLKQIAPRIPRTTNLDRKQCSAKCRPDGTTLPGRMYRPGSNTM